MRKLLLIIIVLALALAVALMTAWGVLALWYRAPFGVTGKYAVAGLFGLAGLSSLVFLFTRRRWQAAGIFAAIFAGLLVWWNTITPPASGDWQPQVARQVTGTVNGDTLTLTNMRAFEWRTADDFTENWVTRSYDLSKLERLDLFMSYWSGKTIAHMVLSFGFSDGEQLAWSAEVRYPQKGDYSPVADAFKTDTLILVASDERDIIGLRTNVRGEDVQLYRLNATPQQARNLLLGYVADANELAAAPKFYNSITMNCTTVIVRIIKLIGITVPMDWRLLVNGYLPEYLYDHRLVDTRIPFSELEARSHVGQKATANGLTSGYSQAIREGAPDPLK